MSSNFLNGLQIETERRFDEQLELTSLHGGRCSAAQSWRKLHKQDVVFTAQQIGSVHNVRRWQVEQTRKSSIPGSYAVEQGSLSLEGSQC